jgi:hypothetical protein
MWFDKVSLYTTETTKVNLLLSGSADSVPSDFESVNTRTKQANFFYTAHKWKGPQDGPQINSLEPLFSVTPVLISEIILSVLILCSSMYTVRNATYPQHLLQSTTTQNAQYFPAVLRVYR